MGDKGGECNLWHPPDEHRLPQFNQEAADAREEPACLSDLPLVKEQQQQAVAHRNFNEKEVDCEPSMLALHGLAASIKQGADRESREAFKILIQEYRPQHCKN